MYWTRNIAHADSAVQGPANTGNKGTALKYISAPNTGALYNFYPRDVVSAVVLRRRGWVAGCLTGWLSVTAGVVSKRLNLS